MCRPGAPRPLTPEGTTLRLVSPDGKFAIAHGVDQKQSLYAFDSGTTRQLTGVAEDERPIRWSADGGSLYVTALQGMSVKIYRVGISDGRRELLKEFTPSDPAGVTAISAVVITPDARSYYYSYGRLLTDLYLFEGIK